MAELDEKIPADFRLPLTRGEKLRAWLVARGEANWLRRVHWLRLAALLAVVALAGYLLLATALFGFARWGRGIETVAWTDVAWPPYWPRYRVARGEKFHAEARACFEKGMWREALMFSRLGVALAPANSEGRLLATRLLFAARRPVMARQTLLEGMAHHPHDPVFLRTLLGFLLDVQEDAHVVAVSRRVLDAQPADRNVVAICAMGAATASLYRGHFDQAEDFLKLVPSGDAVRDVKLLRAKVEWERGGRDHAIKELRDLAKEWPRDYETHRELASCLRLEDRADEARRVVLAFQLARPELPVARIDLLRAYRDAGAREAEEREVAAFLADYSGSEKALLLLGAFAAAEGDVRLARRLRTHAATRALAGEHFDLLVAEACVVAGEFTGALEVLRELSARPADGSHRDHSTFLSLRLMALYGAGDRTGAELVLGDLLAHPDLRSEKIVAVARRLMALNQTAAAQQILLRITELDPHDQAALTLLVELELSQGMAESLTAHLRRLLKMRRPSPDLLRIARLRLGTDIFLFSEEAQVALREIEAVLARAETH